MADRADSGSLAGQAESTTPATKSAPVFISYASQDKTVADAVCKALEKAGVACWIAPRDVTPGVFYAESIVHAIDSSKVIVLVLSQFGSASQHVLREVERASSRRHPVVSFRTDATPLPAGLEYFLNSSQWLDASAIGVPRALPKLVEAVKNAIALPSSAAQVTITPANKQTTPRPTRALVAVSAIIVAAIGYFVADKFWLSNRSATVHPAASAVAGTDSAQPQVATIPDKSVAVLPFLDMSEKQDQGYFSDGIAEEMLNLLAKIPDLRVVSRSSAFSFKGKQLAAPDIGRRLNVAHLLEGSVRKSGGRLRINAQLIDARADTELWSETYDRAMKDIFAVQDEISAAVVKHLKITLLSQAPRAQRVDAQAFALFLQARQLGRLHTAEGYAQSVKLYQQGLAIDPAYPEAWTSLAYNYRRQSNNGMRPLDSGYKLAGEALRNALAIDPNYARAHAELGRISLDYDADPAAAAQHLTHALALDPTNPDTLGYSAILADSLGRLSEGIAINEYALVRDPVNPTLHNALGIEYRYSKQYAKAIAQFHSTLTLSPDDISAHYQLGVAQLLGGRPELALNEVRLEPHEAWRTSGLALVLHSLSRKQEADAALATLIEKFSKSWPYNIALIFSWRGEIDRAFEFLEKSVVEKDPSLSDVAVEPMFSSLQQDPRWLRFLRKIGKAPDQLAAVKFEVNLPKQSL